LVSLIDSHPLVFHHALCFFNKGIAQFSGFEQEEANRVLAMIDRFALIIDFIQDLRNINFDTDHGFENFI
jgi:hypothetical protein